LHIFFKQKSILHIVVCFDETHFILFFLNEIHIILELIPYQKN